MTPRQQALVWLEPGQDFPPASQAWSAGTQAPGLLAAGGDLSVASLTRAYSQGIFPWYSQGQPILWWSTAPRMVLQTADFRLHRSLRQHLQKFRLRTDCEIRFDFAFERVIQTCAAQSRAGQSGTWIQPEMVQAYVALHRAGLAHSVETWVQGELVGGLYCVALGQAVFGESMFAHATDASKTALTALVAFCRQHGMSQIDCQQNTAHLASLGAREVPREQFLQAIAQAQKLPAPIWKFEPIYWQNILSEPSTSS